MDKHVVTAITGNVDPPIAATSIYAYPVVATTACPTALSPVVGLSSLLARDLLDVRPPLFFFRFLSLPCFLLLSLASIIPLLFRIPQLLILSYSRAFYYHVIIALLPTPK